MKKLLPILLVLAIVLSLAACGSDDPHAGIYNATSCTALGFDLDCEGDWLELKNGGKAELCLMGEEYFCSWTLEGENFTLKNRGDEFSGTLENGIITLDFGDMVYIYIMDGVIQEDGKTVGHIHQWQDADCISSKVCTDCGETEGTPLGHDGTDPNYQDPSICIRCGIALGDVLQPDMEKYGFTEFMELGVVTPYETSCKKNDTVTSVADALVTRYEIFDSAEGYPAREGYEWRVAEIKVRFYDQNAKRYSALLNTRMEDYYTTRLLDESAVWTDNTMEYTLSYHGQEYQAWLLYDNQGFSGWKYVNGQKETTWTGVWAYCVPVGYDGAVAGLINCHLDVADEESVIDHDPSYFRFFRLN